MLSVRRSPDVVFTELEDGAVLLHTSTGYYYSLDAVGVEIWRLLGDSREMDGLARSLTGVFEVQEEEAGRAARRLLDELEREDLIVHGEDGESPTGGKPAVGEPHAPEQRRPFRQPELVKHDEPLSDVSTHPFDPQLPLAE